MPATLVLGLETLLMFIGKVMDLLEHTSSGRPSSTAAGAECN